MGKILNSLISHLFGGLKKFQFWVLLFSVVFVLYWYCFLMKDSLCFKCECVYLGLGEKVVSFFFCTVCLSCCFYLVFLLLTAIFCLWSFRFNLIRFSDDVTSFKKQLVEATQENCQHAVQWIDHLNCYGETATLNALKVDWYLLNFLITSFTNFAKS